jgi:hypothetical protein
MTDRKHSKVIVRSDWTKAKYKVKKDWKLDVWRPTKKTPEVLKKLEEAYRVNCTDEEASAHAGIWLRTLNDWKEQDPEFSQQIQAWKKSYYFSIKNASFQRAQNIKNRDSTDILFKIDKSYSDKQDIDVKWEVSLVWIAKAMQQKRLDREKWEDVK